MGFLALPDTYRVCVGVRLPPLAHAPIVRELHWESQPEAKQRTYDAIVSKMGGGSLNDKQKEHVDLVYKEYVLPSVDWIPESVPDLMQAAVNRCSWVASPAFRLRVYGEFCQYLHPESRWEELGQLRDSEKKDAESCFLQSTSRPHLSTHLDQIRDALEAFSVKYPRFNSSAGNAFEGGSQFMQMLLDDEARIREEMEQRWS